MERSVLFSLLLLALLSIGMPQAKTTAELETQTADGCWYNNIWYPVSVMEPARVFADRCLEVFCYSSPSGPQIGLRFVSDGCTCCEDYGRLYPRRTRIYLGNCEQKICTRRGQWRNRTISAPRGPCPMGSLRLGGRCLILFPMATSWGTADMLCNTLGGDLTRPRNPRQNSRLLNALVGAPAAWLGFNSLNWPITSGRPWDSAPSVWYNDTPVIDPGSGCLGYRFDNDGNTTGGWSLYDCSSQLKPICSVPSLPCSQTQCNNDGVLVDDGRVVRAVNECVSIVCQSGYLMPAVAPGCCTFESTVDGVFLAGVYPPGAFSPTPDLVCTCENAQVQCSERLMNNPCDATA